METPMRLDEAAFRATLQLVIPDVKNQDKIKGFGSGFLLRHKCQLFFITADHVVHLDDHDESNETGQRLGIDYTPQIITNIQNKGSLTSVILPIGGFYHLTGFKMDKEDYSSPIEFFSTFNKIAERAIDINDDSIPIDVRIASFPDMAIAKMQEPLACPILNNAVVDEDGNAIIAEGTPKIVLDSQYISSVDDKKWYIIAGTIGNYLKNSVILERKNIEHALLKYIGLDSDKNVLLETPEKPNIDLWSGLSGAPVLNEDGQLVGMLIRGPKSEPIITVVPIDKIIWFLDIIIQNEGSIEKMETSL